MVTKSNSFLIVKTYEELAHFAQAFFSGHINLLLIVGDPGLSKSRTFKETPNALFLEGSNTPISIYCDVYDNRDKVIVLDDVDGLYSDKKGVNLLKCLCQTERSKRVTWNTNTPILRSRGNHRCR